MVSCRVKFTTLVAQSSQGAAQLGLSLLAFMQSASRGRDSTIGHIALMPAVGGEVGTVIQQATVGVGSAAILRRSDTFQPKVIARELTCSA